MPVELQMTIAVLLFPFVQVDFIVGLMIPLTITSLVMMWSTMYHAAFLSFLASAILCTALLIMDLLSPEPSVYMVTIETYFILMMISMSWICGKRHGRQKLDPNYHRIDTWM